MVDLITKAVNLMLFLKIVRVSSKSKVSQLCPMSGYFLQMFPGIFCDTQELVQTTTNPVSCRHTHLEILAHICYKIKDGFIGGRLPLH